MVHHTPGRRSLVESPRQSRGLADRVSRNTVRALLEAHAKEREAEHTAVASRPPRAPRASKVDAFQARVLDLLALYPDITAQRVFETLR